MPTANLTIAAVSPYNNVNSTTVNIVENIATGTVVGKITGWVAGEDLSKVIFTPNTQPGSPGNDFDRYEIVRATAAGPSGQWAVGDWIVRIKDGGAKFNYEDTSAPYLNRIKFDVTFTSGYAQKSDYNTTFTFNVNDVNEGPTNLALSANTVAENNTGAVIGTLSAFDEDDDYWLGEGTQHITFEIVAGLDGAKFEIANNQLRVKAGTSLDYEAGDLKSDANGKYYEVQVRAKDAGGYDVNGVPTGLNPAYSEVKTYRVYVTDVNEGPTNTAPHTIRLNNSTTVAVDENSTVIGTLSAIDNEGNPITYAITAGDPNGIFTIVKNGNVYELRVAAGKVLDYETQTSYDLKITASDGTLTSPAQDIRINVNDVFENTNPSNLLLNGATSASVNENQAGAILGTLSATDNETQAANLTYTLVTNPGNAFEIDAATKRLKLKDGVALDYEALPPGAKYIDVVVQVSDGQGGTAQETFRIHVGDLNDNNTNPTKPQLNGGTSVSVNENQAGAVLGTLTATDNETLPANLTYTITTNPNNMFEIVTVDGTKQLKLKAGMSFDYENLPAGQKYVDVVVQVDDGQGGTNSETFRISVDDVFENTNPTKPKLNGGTAVDINENQAGAILGTLSATDNETTAANLSYTLITNPGNAFEIEIGTNGTKRLKLKDGAFLDYEALPATQKYIEVEVQVSDGQGGTNTEIFRINVKDVVDTNTPPTISVTGPVTFEAQDTGSTVNPFTGVSFADNQDDTLTLTISFAAADGKLVGNNVGDPVDNLGTRTYTFTGRADVLAVILDNVSFDPEDVPGATAPSTRTTQFAISVTDGLSTPVTNTAIKVVTTITDKDPANNAPVLRNAGTQANPVVTTILDNAAQGVNPFAGVTIEDDSQFITATIKLDDDAKGFFRPTSLNGFAYNATNKTYSKTGTVLEVQDALRKLEFDARERPGSAVGAKETTTFTLSVTDGEHTMTSEYIQVESYTANRAPTDIGPATFSVQELTAGGTGIGQLATTDPNTGDTFTYQMIGDGAGGRFKVTTSGQVLVDNGFKLDFEQAASHKITVLARDAAGATVLKDIVIAVGDVNPEFTVGSADNDIFKGGAAADNLAGNLGNDSLYGADGKDTLRGDLGDDKLWGGYGNDRLYGGKGKDVFVFDGRLGTSKTDRKVNFDSIKDYSVKDDSLWFENTLFKSNKTLYAKIKNGKETKAVKLSSKFFSLDKAKDKDDFFIYDTKKNVLSYDADGSGSKAAIELASFTKNSALKKFAFGEILFI